METVDQIGTILQVVGPVQPLAEDRARNGQVRMDGRLGALHARRRRQPGAIISITGIPSIRVPIRWWIIAVSSGSAMCYAEQEWAAGYLALSEPTVPVAHMPSFTVDRVLIEGIASHSGVQNQRALRSGGKALAHMAWYA